MKWGLTCDFSACNSFSTFCRSVSASFCRASETKNQAFESFTRLVSARKTTKYFRISIKSKYEIK
jgi:hypothetical protein